MAPDGERDLLNRARSGDSEAQTRLYTEFFAESRPIRALLAREVDNHHDREDIIHDAFVSLLRSSAEFRGDARLQTFIYRVVQITILQKRRDARSDRQDRMVRLNYELEGEEHQRELAIRDYQFEEIDAGETAHKLCSLLPEPLRTAFRLRMLEDLSYEEIARKTATPINTVATRIFRARSLLAALFGGPRAEGSESARESFPAMKKVQSTSD